jgi:hypothetical protein
MFTDQFTYSYQESLNKFQQFTENEIENLFMVALIFF